MLDGETQIAGWNYGVEWNGSLNIGPLNPIIMAIFVVCVYGDMGSLPMCICCLSYFHSYKLSSHYSGMTNRLV